MIRKFFALSLLLILAASPLRAEFDPWKFHGGSVLAGLGVYTAIPAVGKLQVSEYKTMGTYTFPRHEADLEGLGAARENLYSLFSQARAGREKPRLAMIVETTPRAFKKYHRGDRIVYTFSVKANDKPAAQALTAVSQVAKYWKRYGAEGRWFLVKTVNKFNSKAAIRFTAGVSMIAAGGVISVLGIGNSK